MKIAIFSGEIPSTTFIEQLIIGISKSHQVLLFGPVTRQYKKNNSNIVIHRTPTHLRNNFLLTLNRSILLAFKFPKNLWRLINEVKKYPTKYDQWIWFTKFLPIVLYKPDILHLQWARDVEFYTFLSQFEIKIIVSLRGAHINYTPIIDGRAKASYLEMFPKIDAFHAVSEAIALESQKYGAIKSKIQLIHSPVPSIFFEKFKDKWKKNSPIRIVSISRLHWKKGFRYGIDAMNNLKAKGFVFSYDIIGMEKPSEEILFQVSQLGLTENVKFRKSEAQVQLREIMASYDILLLNSLEEGIANVVLEAMAMGLLVISTDCGGMAEVVIPKQTGWLVPIRNPTAIAEAIIEISESPGPFLDQIRQNANNLVKNEFNSTSCIEQFLKLYEKTLHA